MRRRDVWQDNHMSRNAVVILLCVAVAPAAAQRDAHEMLNSVLWVQTSVEHDAAYEQAYRQARAMLDRARKDRRWTAAIEQTGSYERLPPAVVLDIDETIVDNSPVEAAVVRRGGAFDPALWDSWVKHGEAAALPGAVAFTRYASSRGVAVIYLTNRNVREKGATRRTLQRLEFPLNPHQETIYCQGERPDWDTEKSTRRAAIARLFRILLLIGDDLGDFLPGVRTTTEERRRLAAPYIARFGERWILLPNPMYGTWESALYAPATPANHTEQLRRKLDHLRPAEDVDSTLHGARPAR
jgi:acid phosphatase